MSPDTARFVENGGPAFPVAADAWCHDKLPPVPTGMTLRDWFAGQALDMCLRIAPFTASQDNAVHIAAQYAYAVADAMLAERAK